jgi:hypothetical protein
MLLEEENKVTITRISALVIAVLGVLQQMLHLTIKITFELILKISAFKNYTSFNVIYHSLH